MLTVLAEGYERLGLYDVAEPFARDALRMRRTALGPEHADVAVSLNVLGWLMRERGDLPQADSLLRDAVAVGRRAFGPIGDPRLARALNDLGVVQIHFGRRDEADSYLRESLDMRTRLLGDDNLGVAITRSNLAVVLFEAGDMAGAIALADSAHAGFERNLGPDHQRKLNVLYNLATMRGSAGDHAAAIRTHRDLLERRIRQFGPRHPTVAQSKVMIANGLGPLREFDEAIRLLDEALDIQLAALGNRHPEVAQTLRVRGNVYSAAGRYDDALDDFDAALDMLPAPSPAIVVLQSLEADAHLGRDDPEMASRALAEASRAANDVYGADHAVTLDARLDLVEFLIDRGDASHADTVLANVEHSLAADRPELAAIRGRAAMARLRLSSDALPGR
jgi:tetratricopeptide (TPR) repeat protein